MIDRPYHIRRRCPDCQGEGLLQQPHCRQCGQAVDEVIPAVVGAAGEAEFVAPGSETGAQGRLPCGHPATALATWATCPTSAGAGRVQVTLTGAEWAARRRQRRMRRLYVAGLTLALLLVLAAVVWREPAYLCPGFWYGLLPLGLAWLAGGGRRV